MVLSHSPQPFDQKALNVRLHFESRVLKNTREHLFKIAKKIFGDKILAIFCSPRPELPKQGVAKKMWAPLPEGEGLNGIFKGQPLELLKRC